MIVRMKRMLERTVWALTEQLKAGDFRPEAYEMRFAGGKIDRIDSKNQFGKKPSYQNEEEPKTNRVYKIVDRKKLHSGGL